MTVYPAVQTASVSDPDARRILTETGLPDASITSFRPVPTLELLDSDQRYLVFGKWDIDRTPMCLDLSTGEVVCVPAGESLAYPVNSTLRAFVESLHAIQAAAPFSPGNPAYPTYQAAADHVKVTLSTIDPAALADEAGFWDTIIDDIANGDYDD
jgi:SUKH-4 immunity protein